MEKRRITHIIWFAYYDTRSPSVRYRGKYPLDFAQRHLGITSNFIIPGYHPIRVFQFIKAYINAVLFKRKNSLVVIQRVQSGFIYANLLKILIRLLKTNTIYDLDDADYLQYPPDTIDYFARHCAFISCGSEAIAQHYVKLNPRVKHITSPIVDLSLVKKSRNEIFTIGWIGGFEWGHRNSMLEVLFPAVASLGFPCKLRLLSVNLPNDRRMITNYFSKYPLVQLEMPESMLWEDEIEVQKQILTFDVGVATLSESPVHQAKSGIKVKQYLNNGIPVISSDFRENNRIVQNNFNGFLCTSGEDFKEALLRFKNMTDEEYFKFSENARKSAKSFNHQRYFQNFEALCSCRFEHNVR